jgi:hypothetical protein
MTSRIGEFAEGNCTPTITAGTPGDLSVAYTASNARWYRSGGRVFYDAFIDFTATYSTASGDVLIDTDHRVPITNSVDTAFRYLGHVSIVGQGNNAPTWPAGTSQLTPTLVSPSGLAAIRCLGSGLASGVANMAIAAFVSGSRYRIILQTQYMAA